ncbi:hypothetical protein [Streptomyces sp. NPDC007883]
MRVHELPRLGQVVVDGPMWENIACRSFPLQAGLPEDACPAIAP